MSGISVGELLGVLADRGGLAPDRRGRIEAEVRAEAANVPDPFYLKFIQGVGAWFAAPCLFGGLLLCEIEPDKPVAVVIGIVALFFALLIRQTCVNTFLTQLALTLSFFGNALVLTGSGAEESTGRMALIQVVLASAIYPFYKDAVSRFIAPTVAVVMVTIWVMETGGALLPAFLLTLMVGVRLFYFDCRRPVLYPLRQALAVSLLGVTALAPAIFHELPSSREGLFLTWELRAVVTAGLISLVLGLAGRRNFREPWVWIGCALALVLGIFAEPGIAVAVGVVALGYAAGETIILGVGLAALPVLIVHFYYSLHLDLASKSAALCLSGVALLVARFLLQRQPFAREAQP